MSKMTAAFWIVLLSCAIEGLCQMYSDPLWSDGTMWQFENGSAMELVPVWAKGYTGKGVNIAILDDGVELALAEIQPNAVADLSYDYYRNITDASPRTPDQHGTHVACVAAGVRDNGGCGFGVAPEAGIIGVRLFRVGFDGGANLPSSDAVKGLVGSISGKERHVYTHVFVTSWGASDTGSAVSGPDQSVINAQRTVNYDGRHGLGAFIVISAGNGGSNNDNCAYDGYVQGPYVIPVQAVSRDGKAPSYTEPCAAALTSMYVGGGTAASNPEYGVLPARCTSSFGGTSAAAPMVGGALALALEAKPTLSRRYLLNMLVDASNPDALNASVTWQHNGAGHRFHNRFGFGLLNVSRLIELAETTPPRLSVNYAECAATTSTLSVKATFDASTCATRVVSVEYVVVQLSLTVAKRGDLELFLTSPNGTQVQLVTKRPLDTGGSILTDWSFSTPFFWGETVGDMWNLEARPSSVVMTQATLTVYGEHPASFYTSTTTSGGPSSTSVGVANRALLWSLAVVFCRLRL